MGLFEAADGYDPTVHANVVEGDFIDDPGASFVVISDTYGSIECAGAAIEDFDQSIGERMLTVLGIPYPQYARLFADYADYKVYYSKG